MIRNLRLALTAAVSGAALVAQALTGAVAVTAAPSPSPSPVFKIGEGIPPSSRALPACGSGVAGTYVLLSQGRAIVVAGTGHFVQAILNPGQSYEMGEVQVRYNQDKKSVTYSPPDKGGYVTEVCKPHT
ncbi:hypothetical protein J7E93_08115 [Streptomyces sp. ISL-36]|uniref:hypothetical protein n=1 Tax=Streptomyces sp. ISL-36 TaxID=2819182 RepID=UPI001BE88060|nr:hypothetical protein [Streptomyces sp. ISL-36]MBT2440083.1 hypothetical protein [Streptomyces sp. ISL-36]